MNELYKWCRGLGDSGECFARIFCFPHAGASASRFLEWQREMGDGIEVVGVKTMAEMNRQQAMNVEEYIAGLTAAFTGFSEHAPFVIFGHSAGSSMALSFARAVVAKKGRNSGLMALVLSADVAPTDNSVVPLPAGWDTEDEVVMEVLRELGGTSEEILSNPEQAAAMVAAMRADCSGISYARTQNHLQLAAPLVAVGGEDDTAVPVAHLAAWKDVTTGEFNTHVFKGGHFYFTSEGGEEGDDGLGPSGAALIALLRSTVESRMAALREESAALVTGWNAATMEYPADKRLHDMFSEAAAAYPDNVACFDGTSGETMTMAEMEELTTLLARKLSGLGVTVDSPVGILMDRSSEYIVAYIAAHKANGAYMPLELAYPPDLLQAVCKESQPPVVVTKSRYAGRLPAGQQVVILDEGWAATLRAEASALPQLPTDPALQSTPDSLAYVVMSSGTTGTPKGICCPHRGAVHSYHWRFENYPFIEGDRMGVAVFFVWECLRPLLKGMPTYVIPDDVIYDPIALGEYVREHRITRMLVTPSLLQLLLDSFSEEELRLRLASLRIMWLCGEVVTVALAQRYSSIFPDCALLNLYSISECHDMTVEDLRSVDTVAHPKYCPVGKAMENVNLYILDEDMQQVPVGMAGEVYVGGPCLARGYLNRPEQTAKRFVASPFEEGKEVDSRLYRTGDRGRFLYDGTLEILGRCDFMVKIRGYSVVLGAVESALTQHPAISAAGVITEGAEGEDKKLVALVVSTSGSVDDVPSIHTLQAFLRPRLPGYAIPPTIVPVPLLPIQAASSKFDRKAALKLADAWRADHAAVMEAAAGGEAAAAPLTGTQATVAGLWGEVLKVDPAGIRASDNFFDLGGHSLLAARLGGRFNATTSFKVPVAEIMRRPLLRDLAAFIDASLAGDKQALTVVSLTEAELDADAHLSPELAAAARAYAAAAPQLRQASSVLVTGGTGHLGSHLVGSLLARGCSVTCIVRAADDDSALARMRHTLATRGIVPAGGEVGGLRAVAGALQEPAFGLSEAAAAELHAGIDVVVHAAADVSLMKPYSAVKATNVTGTQHVLTFAALGGGDSASLAVRPVVYVSSNGVFPPAEEGGPSVCLESDTLQGYSEHLHDGYSRSKWVADRMCQRAAAAGLPVTIVRGGNLGFSQVTGVWNAADFMCNLLTCCVLLEAVPQGAPWSFDITPVNFAADGLAELAMRGGGEGKGKVMHAQVPFAPLPASTYFSWLQRRCQAAGLALASMELSEWTTLLAERAEAAPASPAAAAAAADKQGASSAEALAARELQMLHTALPAFTNYLQQPYDFSAKAFVAAAAEHGVAPREVGEEDVATMASWLLARPCVAERAAAAAAGISDGESDGSIGEGEGFGGVSAA